MAILSDRDLQELIEAENAVYVEEGPELDTDVQIGPSSVDLRLGYSFGILNTRKIEMVDTKDMEKYKEYIKEEEHRPEEGVIIHPGEFILGSSLETLNVPDNLVARVEGRSSYGRLGIVVHATAGFVDPGFEGQITLEMQNLGNAPVRVYPEDRICQVVFETMTSEAETPYGEKEDAKYQGQEGATGSKLDREKR
ncbi:MAG: dCTP deaminase [Candidatus Nanohaloarchaea archaeon]